MTKSCPEIGLEALSTQELHLWNKAQLSTKIHNTAYAVILLADLITRVPGFIEGRKLLRSSQIALCPNERKDSVKRGKRISLRVKLLCQSNPSVALEKVETLLTIDPLSVDLNEALYQCSLALGMIDTAEFALETIHQYRASYTAPLHRLAAHYSSATKYLEAARVYQTIIYHKPTDSKAIRCEKDCIAKASMANNTPIHGLKESALVRKGLIDKSFSDKDTL